MFVTFILDTVILVALVMILGRDRRPKLPRLVLVSLAIAAAYSACDLLPTLLLGQLIVVPLILATGIALIVYCRLRLKPAAIASGLFFTVHILLRAVVGWFL